MMHALLKCDLTDFRCTGRRIDRQMTVRSDSDVRFEIASHRALGCPCCLPARAAASALVRSHVNCCHAGCNAYLFGTEGVITHSEDIDKTKIRNGNFHTYNCMYARSLPPCSYMELHTEKLQR